MVQRPEHRGGGAGDVHHQEVGNEKCQKIYHCVKSEKKVDKRGATAPKKCPVSRNMKDPNYSCTLFLS